MKHIVTCAFWLAVEQLFKENPDLKTMFYQATVMKKGMKSKWPHVDLRYNFDKREISVSQGKLLVLGHFTPGKDDCLFCFSAKELLENGSQEHISSFFCWAPYHIAENPAS
ncbi:MAG: hypothetical protein HGB37_03555 [Candidatus Moranbacteria bacterium]|nr:hypothetical protein [Candidatus Moranbacteria bacterium]